MSDESRPRADGRSPGGGFDATVTPKDLKVQLTDQRLAIDWQDGRRSEVNLAELRRLCPCATCRTEREAGRDNPLKILKADPADLRVTSARLVGNYAIQFFWSDGHNTGIFDFRFLRQLGSTQAGCG